MSLLWCEARCDGIGEDDAPAGRAALREATDE